MCRADGDYGHTCLHSILFKFVIALDLGSDRSHSGSGQAGRQGVNAVAASSLSVLWQRQFGALLIGEAAVMMQCIIIRILSGCRDSALQHPEWLP